MKDEAIEADLVAVLKEMRQLTRYEVDDRQYLEFQNYAKWQKIDHPSKSSLPSKEGFDEPSPRAQGDVAPKLIRLGQLGQENKEKPPSVVARKTRARRTYLPVDDEFLEQMRTKYEPDFGPEVYAVKVRKCLQWADDKGYKDRRTYLEDWLASDAQKLSQERTNGNHQTNQRRNGTETRGAARHDANGKPVRDFYGETKEEFTERERIHAARVAGASRAVGEPAPTSGART